MPPRSQRLRLQDILECISRIDSHTAGNLRRAVDDPLVRDAVLYNLLIIGEATKNLSPETRQREQGIDWASVGGMRDFLMHEYFRTDLSRIKALDRHLSSLKTVVERLLREIDEG